MPDLKSLTATILVGYVANTKIEANQIPNLIASISSVLDGLGKPDATSDTVARVSKATPAQIRRSITDDAIISFEDGRSYKSMKRSLVRYGLTPSSYREKWGLPADYPMAAPAYSAARSAMALKIGLGSKRSGAPAPVAAKPKASKGPGRPRKETSETASASKAISPSDDTLI